MSDLAQNNPVISLTDNAVTQIKSMLTEDVENRGKPLRVYVERGGCSGMQYGLVFDEERPDDLRAECEGVAIVIDSISANYLRGSKVDFVDSLTGGGFKVVNPN